MTEPTPGTVEQIVEFLERTNDVRDWPEDERDLHRNCDWSSFDHRRAAMVAFRAEKIMALFADVAAAKAEALNEAATDAVFSGIPGLHDAGSPAEQERVVQSWLADRAVRTRKEIDR